MFRVAGLILTVFLVVFAQVYSLASYQQQQKLPQPIRVVADHTTRAIASSMNGMNLNIANFFSSKSDTAELVPLSLEIDEDLSHTDYTAHYMVEKILTGSILDNSSFKKAILTRAALDKAKIRLGTFDETILVDISARGTNFAGSTFTDTDLSAAKAQSASFKEAHFLLSHLTSGQYEKANFESTSFELSYAEYADFNGANFRYTQANRLDFTKAILDNADFYGAKLDGTNLHLTSMKQTDFSNADLTKALGLTQTQLNKACGDDRTLLPEGMTIPNCSAPLLAENNPAN